MSDFDKWQIAEARCADLQARCERLEKALEYAASTATDIRVTLKLRAALQHTTEKAAPAGEG